MARREPAEVIVSENNGERIIRLIALVAKGLGLVARETLLVADVSAKEFEDEMAEIDNYMNEVEGLGG